MTDYDPHFSGILCPLLLFIECFKSKWHHVYTKNVIIILMSLTVFFTTLFILDAEDFTVEIVWCCFSHPLMLK